MQYLDRFRAGSWPAVGIFLAIALTTIVVLTLLLKKSNAAHLTVGAALVMLIYLTIGAFMLLASRIFVAQRPDER